MASLVRWDPFQDLLSLERDMGRLFADFGLPVGWRRRTTEPVVMMPSIDVIARGEDMLVRAELPGVRPEDLDISVTEGVLTIKGERKDERRVEEADYIVRETSYGSFERSIRLPKEAEADKVRAEFHDGLLEITVPKAAIRETPVHHIAIEAPKPETRPEEHH